MHKVLSIDGGGIRGVIPSCLLAHIEEETDKPISELFDLIVGTSTGGIIAAMLTVKNGRGRPKFSAADVVQLYSERGREIFQRSLWRGITLVGGAFEELYDHKPLERILNEYLEDNSLTDCIKPVVMTSYDIESRKPYFFKTSKAADPDRNHYLRDAVRATSAAPSYFEPAEIYSLARSEPTRRVLIDGGVFVNNPAMCAYVEAVSSGKSSDSILLLSLGTGVTNREIFYEDAKDWGKIGWMRPVIDIMMDGQADATHYHLDHLLSGEGENQRYFRFDIDLKGVLDDLDAAHAGNINNLKEKANQIIETKNGELRRLIQALTA